MKTLKIFSVLFIASFISFSIAAQTKTETFKVAGECEMCKKKIEKSAKEAGASYAFWNQKTKVLTVKYNSRTTNAAKIQQKIAGAGYDTPGFKATDDAYGNLEKCCQYDRENAEKAAMHCSDSCNMKDGKCVDMSACKEKGCCKNEAECKEKNCCSKEGTSAANMQSCRKNEKMSANSDGKPCCKKS